MNSPIYIRYKGNEDNESIIPFEELGESLIGFNKSFKQLSRVIKLNGEIELKARSTTDGSLVIDAIVQFSENLGDLFPSLQEFLEFAKIVGEDYRNEAIDFFNSITNGVNTLNDYFMKRPLDLLLLSACLAKLWNIVGKIGKERKEKEIEKIIEEFKDEIPERIILELSLLIKRQNFKDAIKPVIEDVAKSIEIDTNRNFTNPARIDQNNFQDFLSEEDRVLPDYEDGYVYAFDGRITSIKSTRGESLTFHFEKEGKEYNLDLYPQEGYSTKAYLKYYKENVHILALVLRGSFYKKPRLKLQKIEFNQRQIEYNEEDQGS